MTAYLAKSMTLALGVSGAWLGYSVATQAQTADIEPPISAFSTFLPPEIEASDVCYTDLREPIGEDWLPHWAGAEFDPRRRDEVRPDFKRLQSQDAERWRDEIERAIGWLTANDPYYTEQHAGNDLISLYLKIDRPEEIVKRNLVVNMISSDIDMTPAQMVQIADLIMIGDVVPANRSAGLALLTKAAYLGKAQAVLRLIAISETGEEIPFWDIENDLAMEIALNDMLGDITAESCVQANRVAGMFFKGNYIPRDMEMAQKWFMFSANLGDGTAAWRVARMHIDAMEITRDTDILIQYLKQAADAGLLQARLKLAQVYEQGSIVERDLDAALAILREDAATGYDVSRVALAAFLLEHQDKYPDLHDLRIETLNILSQIEDSRGWVYTHLGRNALAEMGRWTGEAEARRHFETAVERRDTKAMLDLAELVLSNHQDAGDFNRAIDLYDRYLLSEGNPSTINRIVAAHVCRSPQAPDVGAAAYWQDMAADLGLNTQPQTQQQILATNWQRDKVSAARMQTRALNDVPRSLLNFYTSLEAGLSGVAGDSALFQGRLENAPNGLRYWGEQLIDNPIDDRAAKKGFNLLTQSAERGNARAALSLALRLRRANSDDATLARARELLVFAASMGNGRAVFELAEMNVEQGQSSAAIWIQYRDMINRNGDFYGLVFAMTQSNGSAQTDYLRRAVAVMECKFDEAITLVDVFASLEDQPQMEKWLLVAENLLENHPAQLVKFGDRNLDLMGEAGRAKAVDYFQRAYEAGSADAMPRLSRLYGDETNQAFSSENAAALLTEMLLSDAPSAQGEAVRILQDMPVSVTDIVKSNIDIKVIYGIQAQRGNRIAMREYAEVLRANAQSADDTAEAASWFERAAIAGDHKAMYDYAMMLAFGLGLQADPDQAATWLNNAARAGNGKARLLLNPGTSEQSFQEVLR